VGSQPEIETTRNFTPQFSVRSPEHPDLLTAVVTDASSGRVLMVAFMDSDALDRTRATGEAHFYSRSRKGPWKKGESSGNVLRVREILVDCDQDALVLQVDPAGPACHTGATSCFYRVIDEDGLARVEP
jgi:phosphoribosyl-AMP cyclohydrolase